MGAERASEEQLEVIRIENAVAAGAKRWTRKPFLKRPTSMACVHYEKGCYLGQEAMAKIHFRGKVNRRLAALKGSRPEPGEEIVQEDKKIGSVTSASSDGRSG